MFVNVDIFSYIVKYMIIIYINIMMWCMLMGYLNDINWILVLYIFIIYVLVCIVCVSLKLIGIDLIELLLYDIKMFGVMFK